MNLSVNEVCNFLTFLYSLKEIDYSLNLKFGISMFLKFRMKSKLLCSATVVKIDMSAQHNTGKTQSAASFLFSLISIDVHDAADILRNLFSSGFDFKILNQYH